MSSNTLKKLIRTLTQNLSQARVSFALIGAIALGMYGFVRSTVDIDFLTRKEDWPEISKLMVKLGYSCLQKTGNIAYFTSEDNVIGKVDFLFVSKPDGLRMLEKRAFIDDELLGPVYVVQPTDYIILKLMAVSNDERRESWDRADIISFFESYKPELVSDQFETLDFEKMDLFARRFGQKDALDESIKTANSTVYYPAKFKL